MRWLCFVWLLGAPALAALPAAGSEPLPVRVERERPQTENRPTLRFLKENRDFVRGRMDALRQVLLERDGATGALDPRWLRYAELVALADSAAAIPDSLRLAESDLLARVAALAALEAELDALEAMLDEQDLRLAELEADFASRQETALLVVVRGTGPVPARMELIDEEGKVTRVEFDPATRTGLAEGGIAELLHELVEPRRQTWEVRCSGEAWEASAPGYVTFTPGRDRINVLELDWSGVDPGAGAGDLAAALWLHRTPPADATDPD